jgi:hypothetical protein
MANIISICQQEGNVLDTWKSTSLHITDEPDQARHVPMTPMLRSRPLGRVELPEDLSADLKKLGQLKFNIDYSEFAIGRWASLALMNRDGDAESSASHEFSGGGRWTANAGHLPVIKDLVAKVFRVETMRSARIFVAQGGGIIRPHRDYLEFKDGFTRLHLVLQTNKRAMNGEGSRAYHMARGSVWSLDAQVLHWAANLADEPRYHVVVDFPSEMTSEECVREALAAEARIAWVEREPIPSEVKALFEHSASMATPEMVEKLLDIADRMYVRFDCGLFNPYDLVLPYLGARSGCVEHAVNRRVYFLGL